MVRAFLISVGLMSATSAAAEWQIRPAFVDLEPVFAECISDPSLHQPFETCQTELDQAYTLRRSVSSALKACDSVDVSDCVRQFSLLGLPLDPLEIADEFRCIRDLPTDGPLSDLHCIEVISRLIETADLTTLHDVTIRCAGRFLECGDLQDIAESLWVDTVSSTHGQLRTLVLRNARQGGSERAELLDDRYRLTIELAAVECALRNAHHTDFQAAIEESECRAAFYASLWQSMHMVQP